MELILIDIIRYLISGLFNFTILHNSKKLFVKKIIIPSFVYAFFLVFLKIFIIDSPIIMLISVIIIFGYLLLQSKFKMYRFSLTYSLFIGCLIECTHILIFKMVSLIRNALQIAEVTYTVDKKLIVFRATVVLLYAIVLFLIYKFGLIEIKVIYKLSNYKILCIFLAFGLSIIIYLKYYIKYTSSDEFHNILSVIFVLFTIMFFILTIFTKSLIKMVSTFEEKNLNPAIEEAKLKKGQRYTGMSFISEKFNLEMDRFKDQLEKIGMDKQDHGSIQIAFAAVLLKYEENPQSVALRSKIYLHISEILGIQSNTVESNISNALKRHWTSGDSKILIKIQENYNGPISEKNGAPTPRDFLIYIVNNSLKEEPTISQKAKKLFLPKL